MPRQNKLHLFVAGLTLCCIGSLPMTAQSFCRIEKYDAQNGLRHHWVQGVQQDNQGFIWLALKEGMLARFDGHTFRHYPMNEAEKQQFGSNNILGLMIDSVDGIYVAMEHQIALFDPISGRYQLQDKLQPRFKRLQDFWLEKKKRNPALDNWSVLKNPTRLVRKAGRNDTLALGTNERVYEILETDSEYWVATFDGLFKFTLQKRLFDTYHARAFRPEEGLLTGRSIYGIAASGGWLFFIEKGLWRAPLEHPERAELYVSGDSLSGFLGLHTDHEGWLWAGRSYGKTLLRIHPENPGNMQKYALPSAFYGQKRSFLTLPDGRIAVACSGGLLLVDTRDGSVTPLETDNITNAWCLYWWENALWAGTETGLWRLEAEGGRFRAVAHFNTDNCSGFRSNKIISIQEAADFLWLGSDGGLIRFSVDKNGQNSTARTFTTAEGLPHNKVYYAIHEGDYLWCGTDRGLSRITLSSALHMVEVPEIRSFHVEDGLPHEEFNTLSFFNSPQSGKIYLGGLNGMIVFSPKNLVVPPPATPALRLIEIEKYDAKQDTTLVIDLTTLGERCVFEHYEQNFTFRFALLAYANPQYNSYQYMLEGFDKKWNPVSHDNAARYTQLPAGHYTLRVRAADHNGNWAKQEIVVPITVKQAWYATWWAWTLYVLALGGIIYFLYQQRLQQVRLAAKAQYLQELDDFKSRFFTNISHEFRTPLTVILGMTEQWSDKGAAWTASETKQKTGLIRRNAENLLRLINQILDLAKLDSKTLKINYIQADVLPYLHYIAESLHSLANTQNILLKVESSEGQVVMDYDPERLLSIVYNLLSNAIKFTPSGGRVVLSIQTLPTLKHTLIISVSDTGVGIPATEMPHLFERFFQAGNQASPSPLGRAGEGHGAGIGLALTKELVKAMGGTIQAESTVGEGSRFTVALPISNRATLQEWTTHDTAVTIPTSLGVGLDAPQSTGEYPELLLIEDNPDVIEYLMVCLQEKYQLRFAYNGQAGLVSALENIPDLIVSDIMMPEMSGFELCEYLKKDERTSHIPVILLTAKADVESRIGGLNRGADVYLAKPFHREELLATIANLLALRRTLQAKYAKAALAPVHTLPPMMPDQEDIFLQKLRATVEPRLGDARLTAEEVAKMLGMSRSVLYAKLSALTDLSFNIYLRKLRLRRAQELLLQQQLNVSEVAYEVGFNDPRYFIRVFSEEFGRPPGEWRDAQR
jgi:signal transduction histidine kinase/DNA-binding response OmpR family regulator